MIIYVDALFIEEFLINFLILFITTKITNTKFIFLKIILSSVIGGFSTIMCLFFQRHMIETIRIFSVFIIVWISMKPKNVKEFIKHLITFYIVSFVIAGICLYTYGEKFKTIIYVLAISSIIYELINSYKSKFRISNYIYDMDLIIDNHKYEIKAFLDTGNELVSKYNEPVIVLSPRIIKCFDDELQKILLYEEVLLNSKYADDIQNVQFNSLGNRGASKKGIRIDDTVLYYKNKRIKSTVIAIASDVDFKSYDSIIGLNYIENLSNKEVLNWKS